MVTVTSATGKFVLSSRILPDICGRMALLIIMNNTIRELKIFIDIAYT
jgi:hypothetical protein